MDTWSVGWDKSVGPPRYKREMLPTHLQHITIKCTIYLILNCMSPGRLFLLVLLDCILHCITLNHAVYYRFRHLKDVIMNVIDCI